MNDVFLFVGSIIVMIQYGFTMGLLAFGVVALVYLVVRVKLKLD